MLIPLGTDRPLRRPTVVTYWLLGLTAGVHLVMAVLISRSPDAALRVLELTTLDPRAITPWSPFTYQFLHADLTHIIGNMLFLFVFGPAVEDRLRRWGFLLLYLLGGAAAGLVHAFFEDNPVVGASGSIAAVTGSFLVFFPLTRIRIILFFFLIGVFQIPAWWFIGFAIAKDLWFQALGGETIAYAAHLGGYAFGAGIAAALLAFKVVPRETYDLFSIGRQAHRRRTFREAVHAQKTGPWAGEAGARVRQPKKQKRRPADTAREEAAAGARSEVAGLVAADRMDQAAAAYKRHLGEHAELTLARDSQLKLANQYFATGDHQTAVDAWERFLKRYPSDREKDQVRLMLALTLGRYLNDPVGAKRRLAELNRDGLTADYAAVAETLEKELG